MALYRAEGGMVGWVRISGKVGWDGIVAAESGGSEMGGVGCF